VTDHFDFDDDPSPHDAADGVAPEPSETHGWVDDWVEDWDDAAETDPTPEPGADLLFEADDAGAEAETPIEGPIDLSFDDEATEVPDAALPDDGSMSGDVLREALVAAGAPEAADVLDGLDVVEPRGAASALDAAGLAGRVEHSDIGTVVEAVQEGHDVVLVGTRSFAAVAVDVPGDALVLESVDDGERLVVSLRDFADAWGVLDHEALFVPAPATGPVQVGGDTWVVAVDPSGLQDPVRSATSPG
jgi:hypothetical protein